MEAVTLLLIIKQDSLSIQDSGLSFCCAGAVEVLQDCNLQWELSSQGIKVSYI